MKPADPIASATLARLYMTQGHWGRAAAILDEVLARLPFDGDALALRARLEPPRPRLAATLEDDRLSLRWQGVTDPANTHVVLCLLGGDDPLPRPRVTSRRCTGAFGRHLLPTPWARGILVASLGRVDPRGYAPAVVAEPLGWG
ncbi:MAG: tetratricopeptide repeat protein [Myxococcales bacterium]|nr:tetratricopeptide repeat protein [Myxococcales bacterium]